MSLLTPSKEQQEIVNRMASSAKQLFQLMDDGQTIEFIFKEKFVVDVPDRMPRVMTLVVSKPNRIMKIQTNVVMNDVDEQGKKVIDV